MGFKFTTKYGHRAPRATPAAFSIRERIFVQSCHQLIQLMVEAADADEPEVTCPVARSCDQANFWASTQ